MYHLSVHLDVQLSVFNIKINNHLQWTIPLREHF